ncbi:MAG: hypothetical protein ABEL76_10275, partial [Bradymonadaceae bacterium]
MSNDRDSRGEFEQAISHLVVQYRDRLGDEVIAEVLREELEDLDVESEPEQAEETDRWSQVETNRREPELEQETMAGPPGGEGGDDEASPESEEGSESGARTEDSAQESEGGPDASYDEGEEVVELVFPSADALDSRIRDMAEFQGLMVSPDTAPPALADVDIVFRVEGESESVEVQGRAVTQSGDSVAVQFEADDEVLVDRLESYVERIRGGGAAASSSGVTEVSRSSAETTRKMDETVPPTASAGGSDTSTAQMEGRPGEGRPTVEHETVGGGGSSTVMPGAEDEPDATWDLDDQPIDAALAEVAQRSGPGVWKLRLTDGRAELRLNSGDLFEIRRSPPDREHDLGRLLVRAGRIDEEDLERARQLSDRREIELSEAIRDQDILPYQQLVYAMKSRVVLMLEELLEAEGGSAAYYSVDRLPENYFHPPVSLLGRLFDHLFERLASKPAEEIREYRDQFQNVRI